MVQAAAGSETVPSPLFHVAVPWRGGDPHRERLWAFARARLEAELPGVDIIEGPSPSGPFNRSAAVNAAVAAGDPSWSVVAVMDADVLIPGEQVYAAVRAAHAQERVVLAFDRYAALFPRATEQLLAGEPVDLRRSVRRARNDHESSCVVVPRTVWEQVDGFDERFVGWGQEDVAFIHAARILTGAIERVPGIVYHLWHPRSPERRPGPQWKANQDRGRAYRAATTPEDVRALL